MQPLQIVRHTTRSRSPPFVCTPWPPARGPTLPGEDGMLGPGGERWGGRGLRIGGAGVDSSGSARGISEGDGSCLGVRPGMIEKGGGTRKIGCPGLQ